VDHAAEKAAVAAGLPHAFWMIEHHPEDPIAARWNAGIVPTIFDPQPDAANLARASKLWMEQADRDGRPASVYANAFQFLRMIDKPTAEKMLLRTQAADPTGESLNTWMKASWPARLGNFYAGVVAGNGGSGRADSTDPYRNFISRAMGPVDPGSAYAAEVRKKLEQSKDVTVLLSAATPMVSMRFPEQHSEGSDPFAFGKTLVQRALELQPQSTWAHQLLNKATDQELTARLPVAVWQGPLESRQQAIQTLLEGDRSANSPFWRWPRATMESAPIASGTIRPAKRPHGTRPGNTRAKRCKLRAKPAAIPITARHFSMPIWLPECLPRRREIPKPPPCTC
jgi:hypothetical protein